MPYEMLDHLDAQEAMEIIYAHRIVIGEDEEGSDLNHASSTPSVSYSHTQSQPSKNQEQNTFGFVTDISRLNPDDPNITKISYDSYKKQINNFVKASKDFNPGRLRR